MTIDVAELRDRMADFEDFSGPSAAIYTGEKHCFDIPGVLVDAVVVFDGLVASTR